MGCMDFFKGKPKIRSKGTSNSGSEDSSRVRAEGKIPPSPVIHEERSHSHSLRIFELDELKNATNGFSRALKIGEGGFGSVYKGFIRSQDGKGDRFPIAVKKLNLYGLQGNKEWLAEVQFLGVIEHPNLVKLIGYCAADSERGIQRLLVYQFMHNKSLEEHLFNRAYAPLSWKLRLKIALGAAEGLAFLHEGLQVQIIYRDFKASNVLLDEEFQPKLSDFGLAREGPRDGRSHVSTEVVGTRGYAAPDYMETGHLTTKSDVWGFGVFLYEILTGRRSLDLNRPRKEQKLLEWVKEYPPDTKRFNMILDPQLKHQYSLHAAQEVARLADRCLSKTGKDRPKMSEVVGSLNLAVHMSEVKGHKISMPANAEGSSKKKSVSGQVKFSQS